MEFLMQYWQQISCSYPIILCSSIIYVSLCYDSLIHSFKHSFTHSNNQSFFLFPFICTQYSNIFEYFWIFKYYSNNFSLYEGQFWNLWDLRISKLSLLLIFGKVEDEIFEVHDTRGHFQFSHFCVILSHFFLGISTKNF